MTEVTIEAATAQLAQLVARAEAGEEVLIVRGSEPVAKLVPARPSAQPRKPGSLKGLVHVPDSFFDPLPPEELEGWGQVCRASFTCSTRTPCFGGCSTRRGSRPESTR